MNSKEWREHYEDIGDDEATRIIDDLEAAEKREGELREAAQGLISALYAYDRLRIDQGMRHAKADAGREVWYRRTLLESALEGGEK